jgi:hypothetical protein
MLPFIMATILITIGTAMMDSTIAVGALMSSFQERYIGLNTFFYFNTG